MAANKAHNLSLVGSTPTSAIKFLDEVQVQSNVDDVGGTRLSIKSHPPISSDGGMVDTRV